MFADLHLFRFQSHLSSLWLNPQSSSQDETKAKSWLTPLSCFLVPTLCEHGSKTVFLFINVGGLQIFKKQDQNMLCQLVRESSCKGNKGVPIYGSIEHFSPRAVNQAVNSFQEDILVEELPFHNACFLLYAADIPICNHFILGDAIIRWLLTVMALSTSQASLAKF